MQTYSLFMNRSLLGKEKNNKTHVLTLTIMKMISICTVYIIMHARYSTIYLSLPFFLIDFFSVLASVAFVPSMLKHVESPSSSSSFSLL